ncbi:hypothetical protein BX666DRAFT_1909487 [Dichotomocladium elegans]|nr:hypothetical protein BX666DRAFT_1909487 [Dichotomocladium elegans]
MGIKNIDLLDEPFPDLICGVCQDILEDPVQVHCPEDHIFCKKCISNYMQQNTTCPVCLTSLEQSKFQPSKFVQRQIGRLRVRCPYHASGCTWQGFFADDHPKQCGYEICVCPNAQRGCIEQVHRLDLEQHCAQCPFELLTCPNHVPLCEPFLRKDKEIHEKTCRSYPCHYAKEGCLFVGTLNEVDTHCNAYCGKIHQRIKDLEEECKRLKTIVASYGNDTKPMEIQPENKPQMAGLDDMELLQQVLEDDNYLGLLSNSVASTTSASNSANSGLTTVTVPSTVVADQTPPPPPPPPPTPPPPQPSLQSSATDLMDISDCFTNPTNGYSPISIPKRASNGKIIRYSKNVRLAHNARRMARQQQAKGYHDVNPFEALLEELDIKSPSSPASLLSPPRATSTSLTSDNSTGANVASQSGSNNLFPFNLDDVTKFLSDFPESVQTDDTKTNNIPFQHYQTPLSKQQQTQPAHPPQSSSQSYKPVEKKKPSSSASAKSPQPPPPSPSNHHSPSNPNTPKRRQMFVLASSYLCNYGNNNNHNDNNNNSNSSSGT